MKSYRQPRAAGVLHPPPGSAAGDDILFVPYWRLKGMAFSCLPGGRIEAGAVDLNHIALDAPRLPWSLGIQPVWRVCSDALPGRRDVFRALHHGRAGPGQFPRRT